MRRPAIAFLVLAAACTGTSAPPLAGSSSSPPVSTAPSPPRPPSYTGPVVLVGSLPGGCDQGIPGESATISFVAGNRAWAVAPDGSALTCLFDVEDPEPYEWGPRADRVLLGGLEIRGVGAAAVSHPKEHFEALDSSWGRPTGKAVVFVDPEGTRLQKEFIDNQTIEDITPLRRRLPSADYHGVVYHPSGLAIAFVADHPDPDDPSAPLSEIWMSSNTGSDPKRLVFSEMGTQFGPIAFGLGGNDLYYSANLADGTHMLANLTLTANHADEKLWVGDRSILRIVPPAGLGTGPAPHDVLLTVGSGCSDSSAVISDLGGGPGQPLIPDASAPTSALGWVDPNLALVAEGGCDSPMNLWVVDAGLTAGPSLLAQDVVRGAVRVAEPTPPPGLPAIGVNAGVG